MNLVARLLGVLRMAGKSPTPSHTRGTPTLKHKPNRDPVDAAQTVDLMRRLFREYLPSHKLPLITAIGCMLIVAASTASIAWLMRIMVNSIFVDEHRDAIWFVGGGVMAAFFAKGIAGYFQATIVGAVGIAIVSDLQRRQFDKLMTLDMSQFSGRHPAKYVAKMLRSARAARNAISLVLTNIFRDAVTLIALVGVMVAQDPLMSAIGLAVAPALIWAVMRIVRKAREVAQKEDENDAGVSAAVTEAIQGLRVVKSFNLEREMSQRVSSVIEKMEKRQAKLNRLTSLTSPLMDISAGFLIGAFIVYAGWQTLSFGKTPGEFMAFITAFLLAYEPARRLAGSQVDLHRQLVSVRRMYNLFDHPSAEPVAIESASPATPGRGGLKFENVSFGYKAHAPVLRNISFEVEPGRKIALVGRSGAGKSTVFNLILGIYRDYAGKILIDDTDISGLELGQLRSRTAYVAQETFLFTGTVRENIQFGRRGASWEKITEAADAANATGFIKTLPMGFDTVIGNHEGQLSGGERQRITIARALVKDAPILLLDEATSALDGETERVVRSAESHLVWGRTTVTIAHRLSTIMEADCIIVLDEGRIVGQGTHKELMDSNLTYQSLFSNGEFRKGESPVCPASGRAVP